MWKLRVFVHRFLSSLALNLNMVTGKCACFVKTSHFELFVGLVRMSCAGYVS